MTEGPVVSRHVGSGRFDEIPDWEQPSPLAPRLDVPGIDIDASGHVLAVTRGKSQIVEYAADGTFVRSWGRGILSERTHGLSIAPDGTVYCVDQGRHVVFHFSEAGGLLGHLGAYDRPSGTGYDGRDVATVRAAGPPFNHPTNVAFAPDGSVLVSDGYGNARVHRFSADGLLLDSWGEPGSGPGQFMNVHGIGVTSEGVVVVADRENDRLQFLTLEGQFVMEWLDVQRPTSVCFDRAANVYVSELSRRAGDRSFRLRVGSDLPGRVSIFDERGRLLDRMTSDGGPEPAFIAPHDLCVDAMGSLYIAEVPYSFLKPTAYTGAEYRPLRKFRPR